jgi:hypothetical protein
VALSILFTLHTPSPKDKNMYPPPVGYVAPESFTFSASADWARILAKGLSFEPYYYGTAAELRPVVGDCLYPLLIECQHALITRPLAADEAIVDGDLYVIEWANADEVAAFRDSKGRALAHNQIAKFLRYICGDWYTQCNDSVARLDGNIIGKVVGVVDVERAAHAGQIAPNAITAYVTQTMSQSVSNGTTAVPVVNRVAGSGTITVASASTVHVTINGDVPQVTCNASITGFNVSFRILKGGVTTGSPVVLYSHLSAYFNTTSGVIAIPAFTIDFVDPSPGAGAVTYNLGVSVTPFGAGGTISVTTSGQMILKEQKK